MPEQSPETQAAAFNVALYATMSLACMLADFIWLLTDEIKYVWPRLRSSWSPRIFVVTRYGGLSSQIFNVYFTVRMYLGVYTTPDGCHRWFSFQAVVVQVLLGSVEGFLMHRIYALFFKSRIVLMILIVFIAAQMASMGVSARLAFPTNEYTETCFLLRGNPGNAFFSTTTMTTNILILFMTFWRYFTLPAKWTKQGIGRVVFRDSGLTLIAISVMMFLLTLTSLKIIKPRTSGNTIYYWLVGILWVSAGRIIVNHEKLQCDTNGTVLHPGASTGDLERHPAHREDDSVQLTSQIEMGALTVEALCRLVCVAWGTWTPSLTNASMSGPECDHGLETPGESRCDLRGRVVSAGDGGEGESDLAALDEEKSAETLGAGLEVGANEGDSPVPSDECWAEMDVSDAWQLEPPSVDDTCPPLCSKVMAASPLDTS